MLLYTFNNSARTKSGVMQELHDEAEQAFKNHVKQYGEMKREDFIEQWKANRFDSLVADYAFLTEKMCKFEGEQHSSLGQVINALRADNYSRAIKLCLIDLFEYAKANGGAKDTEMLSKKLDALDHYATLFEKLNHLPTPLRSKG